MMLTNVITLEKLSISIRNGQRIFQKISKTILKQLLKSKFDFQALFRLFQ